LASICRRVSLLFYVLFLLELAIFIHDDVFGADWAREPVARTAEALRKEPVGACDQEGSTEDEDRVVEVLPRLLHVLVEVCREKEEDRGHNQEDRRNGTIENGPSPQVVGSLFESIAGNCHSQNDRNSVGYRVANC
jgi:hypothetical protein